MFVLGIFSFMTLYLPFLKDKSSMPFLYIIAGCNGAGKTTASYTVLPEMLGCREFVNADEIAKGLSPFQPETVSFEAGRIMLNRIRELIRLRVDFAFETTLSTKSYKGLIEEAQTHGYFVVMIFFWLKTKELAKERVKLRVENGGHFIAADVIERRYDRGVRNLIHIFRHIVHAWVVYDNSDFEPKKVAMGIGERLEVNNHDIWNKIQSV
jgi:predicted ABC-type ATPase